MRHGSLFSGIGGFDLAAQWMGWENVFHCEWNGFGQQILKYYWPNAESFTDITKTDFKKYAGKIDIVSGGFPCQPFSTAGKRKGKEDDRHLWPEMLRAIREIQPRWVVGENVRGLINWSDGLVFHEVQTDLEAEGYEVFPFLLPASGVNAPHERYRIWFIAYSKCNHDLRSKRESNGEKKAMEKRTGEENSATRKLSRADKLYNERHGKEQYDFTNCNSTGIQRGETSGNIEIERTKAQQYFGGFNKLNDWSKFPTQSPICGRNDGIPNRVDRLKQLGNAIVPQVALQIFKTIEQYENLVTQE